MDEILKNIITAFNVGCFSHNLTAYIGRVFLVTIAAVSIIELVHLIVTNRGKKETVKLFPVRVAVYLGAAVGGAIYGVFTANSVYLLIIYYNHNAYNKVLEFTWTGIAPALFLVPASIAIIWRRSKEKNDYDLILE